jgi:hypothetical protein
MQVTPHPKTVQNLDMTAAKLIIPGERFYKLSIIREVSPGVNKHRRVEAICDCGKIKTYEMAVLRAGNTKSCGCYIGNRGRATKGKTAWNKGILFSQESRTKMAAAKQDRKRLPFTRDTREKLAASKTGSKNPMFGKTGNQNPNWRGGYPPRKIGTRYQEWRLAVLAKNMNTCVVCGSNQKLHAHHRKSWRDFPKLRYLVWNGVTVCQTCHIKYHSLLPKPPRGTKISVTHAQQQRKAA